MSGWSCITSVFNVHALVHLRLPENGFPSYANRTITKIKPQVQFVKVLRADIRWVEVIKSGSFEVKLEVVRSRKGNIGRPRYMLPTRLNRPLLKISVPRKSSVGERG